MPASPLLAESGPLSLPSTSRHLAEPLVDILLGVDDVQAMSFARRTAAVRPSAAMRARGQASGEIGDDLLVVVDDDDRALAVCTRSLVLRS